MVSNCGKLLKMHDRGCNRETAQGDSGIKMQADLPL